MIAAEGAFRELRRTLQVLNGVRKIAALVGLVAALEQRRAFFRLSRDRGHCRQDQREQQGERGKAPPNPNQRVPIEPQPNRPFAFPRMFVHLGYTDMKVKSVTTRSKLAAAVRRCIPG